LVGGIGLAVVYWTGGNTQLEGVFLALSLGGLGVGMVEIARSWLPHDAATEPRGRLASTDEERRQAQADFAAGEQTLSGRRQALRFMAGAAAALGAALLFPIRSLGPRPGAGLLSTPFGSGVRLVGEDGRPVSVDSLSVGGAMTVFPEGHMAVADAPAMLIRVDEELLDLPSDRRDWVVDGIVAYSKICTHAGCPVGLFEAESGLLLCPCHQSTFDVLDGARPTFGPAARPLPQLPLAVDDDGFLIAAGDYSDPVGPGFWNRP
jgi:ubiquinol-cytochrome c reductase iron-sulfur subunit